MSLWDDNEPEGEPEEEDVDTEPIRPATSIDWSRDDDWTDEEDDVDDWDGLDDDDDSDWGV